MIAATVRRLAPAFFRDVIALVLVFVLSSNLAFAQDVQVSIVPRVQSVPDAGAAQQSQTPRAILLLPPGTTLPLGLLRPLSLRSSSAKGKGIYLQVTFPVTDSARMVIPPGAYVQAIIEKATKKSLGNPDLEFELSHARLIFPNGYTVAIAGTVNLVHLNARLQPPAPRDSLDQPTALAAARSAPAPAGEGVPVMSAVGITPPPLPPLPPLPQPSFGGQRAIMIAMGVVVGIGAIAGTVLLLHHRSDIYVETGTPLEIVLSAPLLMDADQVNSALQQYSTRAATSLPQIVEPPKRPKTCYDPGTPGTPDTVIRGTPPTPPTVIPGVNGMPDTVIPGSPGTPDTVIPGTPATPPSSYPCPK